MNRMLLALVGIISVAGTLWAETPRERLRFDSDWKFVIDDRDLIELKGEVELKDWRL